MALQSLDANINQMHDVVRWCKPRASVVVRAAQRQIVEMPIARVLIVRNVLKESIGVCIRVVFADSVLYKVGPVRNVREGLARLQNLCDPICRMLLYAQ